MNNQQRDVVSKSRMILGLASLTLVSMALLGLGAVFEPIATIFPWFPLLLSMVVLIRIMRWQLGRRIEKVEKLGAHIRGSQLALLQVKEIGFGITAFPVRDLSFLYLWLSKLMQKDSPRTAIFYWAKWLNLSHFLSFILVLPFAKFSSDESVKALLVLVISIWRGIIHVVNIYILYTTHSLVVEAFEENGVNLDMV